MVLVFFLGNASTGCFSCWVDGRQLRKLMSDVIGFDRTGLAVVRLGVDCDRLGSGEVEVSCRYGRIAFGGGKDKSGVDLVRAVSMEYALLESSESDDLSDKSGVTMRTCRLALMDFGVEDSLVLSSSEYGGGGGRYVGGCRDGTLNGIGMIDAVGVSSSLSSTSIFSFAYFT